MLENLGHDLKYAIKRTSNFHDFKAMEVKVGVAVSAGGDLQLASLGGELGGFLVYENSGRGSLEVEDKRMNSLRRKFRRGVKKTASMGKSFTKKISRMKKRKWGVASMTTEFALTAEGDAKLVTLGVTPSLEITYENTNF
jgi:hypothetical protein